MPLVIDFRSGDKLLINGVVVENGGPNSKLIVHNESAILREREVLTAEDTVTPAANVYYALQCAYVFPDRRDEYLRQCEAHLAEYLAACPSAEPIGKEVRGHIAKGALYKALKACQKLIRHEGEVLRKFQESLVGGEAGAALAPAAGGQLPVPAVEPQDSDD